MYAYRYSEWDGSQDVPPLDADDVLASITDDLMSFGDLQYALRSLLQRGMRTPLGQRLQGLRQLLQQLRQQRRNTLDHYDLRSAFDDIKKRLEEIVRLEKETVGRRLDEATRQLEGRQSSLQPFQEAMKEAGVQQGQPDRQFAQMLKDIAEKKKEFLESLPEDAGGQVKELQKYEFMDPEAGRKFQELMEMLKQAMVETFFKDLSRQIAGLTPQDMQRLKEMVRDLNQMLSEKMAGGQPDFQRFMQHYGDMFGPNPPESLEELIAQMQQQLSAMQSLLDSLPADMRRQLQELLLEKIGDPELEHALQELAINLDILYPTRDLGSRYPFHGDEELDLLEALRLMDRLQGLDELERQLTHVQYGGSLDDVDEDSLRELLGEEAYETFRQLKQFLEVLEEAGYIRRKSASGGWELTPRAIRKIGQKALGEIYAQLKKGGQGKHPLRERGSGGERTEHIKRYEFGDPFDLHLGQTVMNAVLREGPGLPLYLDKDDFEVYRSEQLTQTATVIMLDLSWSMALRGSFQAAKKVALALNNLIRSQFPRDTLYIVGFSAYARELTPDQLPYIRWDEAMLGTNMHHAFMLAQRLLDRHKTGTRQVIMISDGEPTAHLEHGRSYFAYPPSPITIRETLKEVRHTTRKGIIINTFMLDRSYYLKEFVNHIARINKGRVFYTTPESLGQYIVVDYVAQKRKRISGA
ncbi:MAG: VWA domain-containing protein [Dehalococcoidia bacterium]